MAIESSPSKGLADAWDSDISYSFSAMTYLSFSFVVSSGVLSEFLFLGVLISEIS